MPSLRVLTVSLIPLFASALAAALPVLAGLPIEQVPEGHDIPLERWVEMADGRTLTYHTMDGAFFAREYYHPGSNRVTLQFADGTCSRGTWDYSAPRYCYYWEREGTVCFRHMRYGDAALIIQLTEDGSDTPLLQLMSGVSDTVLSCGPPLIG